MPPPLHRLPVTPLPFRTLPPADPAHPVDGPLATDKHTPAAKAHGPGRDVPAVGAPRPPCPSALPSLAPTHAELTAFTAQDLRRPWEEVRARLHKAIPEAAFMNGPADESAEAAHLAPPRGSASVALYGHFWREADRAWGGVQALHAVYNGRPEDCVWLTQNQAPAVRLSWESFQTMHHELLAATPRAANLQALLWAVLCNDLGKTEKLKQVYREKMRRAPPDHDRLLGELLEAHPACFPAFQSLAPREQRALINTFACGSDIAQFVQLEVAPEELAGFGQLTEEERRLYILHSKYDVAGAASDAQPNGSVVYTEAAAREFDAVTTALATFAPGALLQAVYDRYVEERARLVGLEPPLTPLQRLTAIVAAMTRVTTPAGRAAIDSVLQEPANQAMVQVLSQHLGTLHVYYGPALLRNAADTLRPQIGAERAKVEGLWLGLACLAQSIEAMLAHDSAALGTIPNLPVRQLHVGDLAASLKCTAVVELGGPLPGLRLQPTDMGAAVAPFVGERAFLGLAPNVRRVLRRELAANPARRDIHLEGAAALLAAMPDAPTALLTLARVFEEGRIAVGAPTTAPTQPLTVDVSALAAKPEPDEAIVLEGSGDTLVARWAPRLRIDPSDVPTMASLPGLARALDLKRPMKRLALIGGGGGSDVIQAAMVAKLFEAAGCAVPVVVSARTAFTKSPGINTDVGARRTVTKHGGEIFPGVYRATETPMTESGRALEHVPVNDVDNVYLVLDRKDGQLDAQFAATLRDHDIDTIVVVDTGGDVLDGIDPAAGRTRPDQDLRTQQATATLGERLGLNVITGIAALGVDAPADAARKIKAAEAVRYALPAETMARITEQYRMWRMDGSDPERYGLTPLVWLASLNDVDGYAAMPLPSYVVDTLARPWKCIHAVQPIMRSLVFMRQDRLLRVIAS